MSNDTPTRTFYWNPDAVHLHTVCSEPLEDYGAYWYCAACECVVPDNQVCEEGS